MGVAQHPLIELRDPMAPDVIEARGVALGSLFDRIDTLMRIDCSIDADLVFVFQRRWEASKAELAFVFGSQAGQFLKFCDFDKGNTLSKAEFVHGITTKTAMLSEVDFQKTWLDGMESRVYAAETGEMGSSQQMVPNNNMQVHSHLHWLASSSSKLQSKLRHYHSHCAVCDVGTLSTLAMAAQVDPHKLIDEFEDEAALAAAQAAAYPLNVKQDVGVKVALTTLESVAYPVPQDSVLIEGTAAQPEAQKPPQTTQPAATISEVGSSGNNEPEHALDSSTSEPLFAPRSLANVAERLELIAKLELMLDSDDFFDDEKKAAQERQAREKAAQERQSKEQACKRVKRAPSA